MAGKKKYTDEMIKQALLQTKGLVYLAAKQLGCDPATIFRRLQVNPKLSALRDTKRGEFVDAAELALLNAVVQGEAWAVCFALKTQGAKRGYVEKHEIKQETKLAVTMSAEDLSDDELAAIAAGGRPRAIAPKDSPSQPD